MSAMTENASDEPDREGGSLPGCGLVSGAVRRVETHVSGVAQGVAGAVGLGRALAGPLAVVGWRMAGQAVGQAAAGASVMVDGVADVGRLALRTVLPREEPPLRPVAVPPLREETAEEAEESAPERALRVVDEAITSLADEQTAEPGPAPEAVEAGAPGTATAVADLAAREHPGVVVPDREADLPIPEWDSRPPASLRARIRNLPLEDLLVLRGWEQEHARRLQVLTSLENRIRKVQSEQLGQG